jgi:hypothetical protein
MVDLKDVKRDGKKVVMSVWTTEGISGKIVDEFKKE